MHTNTYLRYITKRKKKSLHIIRCFAVAGESIESSKCNATNKCVHKIQMRCVALKDQQKKTKKKKKYCQRDVNFRFMCHFHFIHMLESKAAT